jgi:exonuclease SbcD
MRFEQRGFFILNEWVQYHTENSWARGPQALSRMGRHLLDPGSRRKVRWEGSNKDTGGSGLKFFHLSDLHLGKLVHEFSMLEEQEYILAQILDCARAERPDAVLIAGDVFDRSVAPADALRVLDDFLVGLAGLGVRVFIIAGNHDSAERLAFAARLMAPSGIHIAPAYEGQVACHTMEDAFGEVDICLMPFLRPAMVRRHFPEERIASWTDAVRVALSGLMPRPGVRRVLLAHQFITGGQTCESEEFSVGGADNVDAAVFSEFDYVALGHLHGPQAIGRPGLRYCGSPLKYSFSEVNHQKTLSVVELGQAGSLEIRELPLTPRRDLRDLRGTYLEVASRAFYENLNREHYYRVTLLDELDQPDAMQKLRVIYPNLMRLVYDNPRTRALDEASAPEDVSALNPLELFAALYEEQNAQPLSPEQRAYLTRVMDRVWEEAK